MKILVYVRQILGDGYQPGIDRHRKCIGLKGAWFQPHPKDDLAVEQALRLKAILTEGPGMSEDVRIIVVAIGPERVEQSLRRYLAVGCDEAVRIWDDAIDGLDCGTGIDDSQSAVLVSAFATKYPPDWIVCGEDSFSSLTVYMSEQLGRPVATAVCGITAMGTGLRVQRRLEKHTITVAMSAPGILAIEKGHGLRYPKHLDRLRAEQQTTQLFGLIELGISAEALTKPSGLVIDAVSSPKPGKKIFPTKDADTRFIDLVMGGISMEGGKQLVEGSPEKLAELAVDKIDVVLKGS